MIDLELDAAKRAMKYAKKGTESYGEEYKNLCKSFPTMIVSNGLAQAVSFYEAKGKEAHREVIRSVKEELKSFYKVNGLQMNSTDKISEFLLKMDLKTYMDFEKYLLDTLKWLRRYVDVYNKD